MDGKENASSRKQTLIRAVKVIAFITIFIILFTSVSRVLTIDKQDMQYQRMNGIYAEEKDSLDMVYIGSSNAYAFWNPLVAWKNYGITGYQYGCSSLPLSAVKYLIREARKTQPDAVYIININTMGNTFGDNEFFDALMHYIMDNMPLTKEKLELGRLMVKDKKLSFFESLEYFFPIIRYHGRWNELLEKDFSDWDNNIKNSSAYKTYLSKVKDISKKYIINKETQEIPEHALARLNDLLDYLDKEKIKAVFVTVPHIRDELSELKMINKANEIIASRNYPVVDALNNVEELNINLKTDYYNKYHTNIHGSIKFTNYISEYLVKNYGFEDKRNNPEFSSWNSALENYNKLIKPHILDFELELDNRDYSLEAVKGLTVTEEKGLNNISWKEAENADGYIVYRKGNGDWAKIGETTKTEFVDKNVNTEDKLVYTVVPYNDTKEKRLYGNFSYNGVTAEGVVK